MSDEVVNLRLQEARDIARASRDDPSRKGDAALVNQWREVCKPRKGGTISPKPPGCKVDFADLFQQWLQDRELDDCLEFDREEEGWRVYRYTKEPVVEAEPDWETAFHGTWWYAAWMILHTGIFLESSDRSLGHDYWEPGVYASPNLDTGLWYARAQVLFGDGVYHRIIFEVKCDSRRRKQNRKKGGVQWVFPCEAVSLHAVWVRPNAPPANGEERISGWQPELEALPPGWSPPPAIVNPRNLATDPWPVMVDPYAWDFSGASNCPPWMRASAGRGGLGNTMLASPIATKAAVQDAKPKLAAPKYNGLYGHWLTEETKARFDADPWEGKPKPRGSLAKALLPGGGAAGGTTTTGAQPGATPGGTIADAAAKLEQHQGSGGGKRSKHMVSEDWEEDWPMAWQDPFGQAAGIATLAALAQQCYGWSWDGDAAWGPRGKRPRW